jgi:hypothetical protein
MAQELNMYKESLDWRHWCGDTSILYHNLKNSEYASIWLKHVTLTDTHLIYQDEYYRAEIKLPKHPTELDNQVLELVRNHQREFKAVDF